MRAYPLVSAITAATFFLLPVVARADDGPPPPASARATNGEYVAPLQQQTQPSYVPQSVALSGPGTIRDWSDDEPVPDGYHVASRTRTGVIAAGASVFGSLYFLSLVAATAGSDATHDGGTNPVAALYVPGLGPFVQMGSTNSATGNLFLAIDGIGQCAGLAMLIYGITTPKKVLVRNDLAKPIIAPMRVGSGYGVGALMRF